MTSTPIILKREKLNHKSLRASQFVISENEGISIYIAHDHPHFYRQIQKAGRIIDQMGVLTLHLQGDWNFEEQWAFQLGFSRFDYPGTINLAKMNDAEQKRFETQTHIWNWIRKLVNTGPSDLSPEMLAHEAETLIKRFAENRYTLKIEKIKGEALKAQGYVGCYSVGRGSEFPPVLLSIKIYPKGQEQQKIAGTLIGKGITFDSGGYVLKPRESGIDYMKADMGGAATVTGAMAMCLYEGVNRPVELILCCAENLVSGSAYRPGDVITYKNGVKVEIVNTDAEGRVVLADGFLKAQEENPALIIDAATLTGAAKIAVGGDFCALFGMDAKLREHALAAAQSQHEGLWPLPLETWHQEAYPSLVADTQNADMAASSAGASTAAGFLSRFVKLPEQRWLHYDLANVYAVKPNSMCPGGATGLMFRSIAKVFMQEL